MREGAYIGAIAAFFVFMLLPIYGENGAPVSIIPTGNVISNSGSMNVYVSNLPLSMVLFFGLEVLGVSLGITAQMVLRRASKKNEVNVNSENK